MQNRVRAIIEKDGFLLTIKRVKENETYWVLPGGGIDGGENHETALIRECKEELGVEIEVQDFVFEHEYVHEKYGKQKEFFYRCFIISGQLGSGDGPEYQENSKYEGTFELQWLKLDEIEKFDLRPVEIKIFSKMFQ